MHKCEWYAHSTSRYSVSDGIIQCHFVGKTNSLIRNVEKGGRTKLLTGKWSSVVKEKETVLRVGTKELLLHKLYKNGGHTQRYQQ